MVNEILLNENVKQNSDWLKIIIQKIWTESAL